MLIVTLTGLVLVAIALCDRRARWLVGVVCLVWMLTAYADGFSPDRYAAIASRVPADLMGALMSVGVIALSRRYEVWALSVPVFFMAMLAAHFAYWFAYAHGVSLWPIYANGLNALFLLQLAFLAGPGGTRIANYISRRAGFNGSWRLAGFVSRRLAIGKKADEVS